MAPVDNQLLGLVLQYGSFGVVVLIFMWIMFKVAPQTAQAVEKKEAAFLDTLTKRDAASAELLRQLITENRALLDLLTKRHDEHSREMAKECREERKEWVELVMREGELNRKARHDFANQIKGLMTEVLEEGIERGRTTQGGG